MTVAGPAGPAGLRARLRAGETIVGTLLNMGSTVAAEICAATGADFLLIDLEHGSASESHVLGLLQAMGARDVPGLVRVESSDRVRAGRVLDLGAIGVVFPQVRDAHDAQIAAAHAQYPPAGDRGVARYNRAWDFGLAADGTHRAAQPPLTICMIETAGALAEVEAIAAIGSVDGVLVGPLDLSYALEVGGQTGSPVVRKAIVRIAEAVIGQGKFCGIVVADRDDVSAYQALGYTLFVVGSDSSVLASAYRRTFEPNSDSSTDSLA